MAGGIQLWTTKRGDMTYTSKDRLKLATVGAQFAVIVVALSWCSEYELRKDSITFEHGNAIAHNIAVQTIDPWPAHVDNTRIDVDGQRVLIAVERYKANKVIPPVGLPTQSISTATGSNNAPAPNTN